MNDNGKRRGWAFWATVTLAVAMVVYPLSLGPACWWSVHRRLSFDGPRTGGVDVVSAELVRMQPQEFVSFERRNGLMEVAFPLVVGNPIYAPIARVTKNFPKPVQDAFSWYLHLWVPNSPVAFLDDSGDVIQSSN